MEADPFVEQEIMPYLDDPTHFYDGSAGDLKPQYLAYLERRQLMVEAASRALGAGRIVRQRLWDEIYR